MMTYIVKMLRGACIIFKVVLLHIVDRLLEVNILLLQSI
jgi:hypothetical protein